MTVSHSAAVISNRRLPRVTPALLTRKVGAPSSAAVLKSQPGQRQTRLPDEVRRARPDPLQLGLNMPEGPPEAPRDHSSGQVRIVCVRLSKAPDRGDQHFLNSYGGRGRVSDVGERNEIDDTVGDRVELITLSSFRSLHRLLTTSTTMPPNPDAASRVVPARGSEVCISAAD